MKLRDLKSSLVSDPVFIEYNLKLRSRIGCTVLIGLKRKGSIKSNAIPDPDLMKETSSILYPVSDCNVKLRNLKSNAVPDPEFIELLKQMEGYITDPGPLSPSNVHLWLAVTLYL